MKNKLNYYESKNLEILKSNSIETMFLFSKPYQLDYDDLLFEENLNLFDETEIKTNHLLVPTIYYRYIIANFCKEFFKDILRILDKENKYFKINYKDGVNEEKYKDAIDKYHKDHEIELNNIKNDIDKWRKDHIEFYRIQICLPPSEEFTKNFLPEDFSYDNFIKVSNITIEECINCYKACNEFIKFIDNQDPNPLNKYCIDKKPMLNYEHRGEYNEFKESLYKKYNILTDQEIKANLPIESVKKTRLSLNRQKADLAYVNKCFDFIKMINE